MVDTRQVNALISARANQIIRYAELAITDGRILERFRTYVLDELGHNGLRTDLAELLDHGGPGRHGKEWQGPDTISAGKAVRHD